MFFSPILIYRDVSITKIFTNTFHLSPYGLHMHFLRSRCYGNEIFSLSLFFISFKLKVSLKGQTKNMFNILVFFIFIFREFLYSFFIYSFYMFLLKGYQFVFILIFIYRLIFLKMVYYILCGFKSNNKNKFYNKLYK